jgi:hypothetical protein
MRAPQLLFATLLVTALWSGCNSAPPEAAAGCNPIIGDDCLTPFPSAFFETTDPTTRTGRRVAIGPSVLPVQKNGLPIKPDRLNQKDGFSPATPFVVYFKAGVKASELPDQDHIAASLLPTSTVQLFDYDSGRRIPLFAELDSNADSGDRQALLIHPAIRLNPNRRYVIAIVSLHDNKGQLLAPAPFRALRDQTALSKSLTPLKARYQDIFTFLARVGLARASLSLAWDVDTASDEATTGRLVALRDTALSMVDAGQLGYTITATTDNPAPLVRRTITATVQVPSYLKDDSGQSTLGFGSDGQPVMRAVSSAPIVIQIPSCAASAGHPLPIVVFGHALFENAADTLASPLVEMMANQQCVIHAATDWIGLAATDFGTIGNALAEDLNNVYLATDRLQQAHVNVLVMTRLLQKSLKDDAVLRVNGQPVTDGSQIYYEGLSLGAIEGTTFMALSPDVTRAALNVPGAEWSLLLFRSSAFGPLKTVLGAMLPDKMDQQLAIAASQSEWDFTDSATFAPHLLQDPLPGTALKHILVQESVDDAQMSNVTTRLLARTMGLPGLAELVLPVFGIDAQPGPLDSAYTQWDSHPSRTPPVGDVALSSDNGAHTAVFKQPLAIDQVSAFFKPDGQVVSTCTGPCNF